MAIYPKLTGVALSVGLILTTVLSAPIGGRAFAQGAAAVQSRASSQVPQAAQPNSAAVASADAEYHDELEAAAASLKADIQAQSDASVAAVDDAQGGPSQVGILAAAAIAILGILALIVVVFASIRARKGRREQVAEMVSEKGRRRKR